MHEDTLLKTRQIKVKKTQYKIINQSTHFINELIYVNFVTTVGLGKIQTIVIDTIREIVLYYIISINLFWSATK